MPNSGQSTQHRLSIRYCKGNKLPPTVICEQINIYDLDEIQRNPINMQKKADCLITCDGNLAWIVETKRTSLTGIVAQFEDTIKAILDGNIIIPVNGNQINLNGIRLLAILEKGMGGERDLFERDHGRYLKHKNGSLVKVNGSVPILTLDSKEIENMIRNNLRLNENGDA